MSRKLSDLTPQMEGKAKAFIEECWRLGVKVTIYNTQRSLEDQARYYRQGRSYLKIKDKAYSLAQKGFTYLSDALLSVGPQKGSKIITNAAPGESFHNLAEAFDAVPVRDIDGDGDLDGLWNSEKYKEEWEVMFNVAEKLGLVAGGRWKGFVDSPHFQLRSGKNPVKIFTPERLKEIFIKNGLMPKTN